MERLLCLVHFFGIILSTYKIKNTDGKFAEGEVVQVVDEEGNILGVAKTKLDSLAMIKQTAVKNIVAAHADDIVLF